MSSLYLADDFLDHAKFIRAVERGASPAIHLWLGMMIYTKRLLSDGIVPRSMVSRVHGPAPRWRSKALQALLDAGLIELVEEGYLVHDFLQWNYSSAEIKARADARKARRAGPGSAVPTVERPSSDRRATVVPNASPNVERPSTLSQAASNDVEHLPANGREHVDDPPSRAQPRSGSGSGSEGSRSPSSCSPKAEPEPSAQTASTSSAKPRRVSKPRGRTQCPPDFQPDDTTLAHATSLGFAPAAEQRCRREFVNWWMGDGGLKANWQATYRNRLDVQAERLGLAPPQPETPAQRDWLAKKRAAEAPPAKPAKNARERVDGVVRDLFAR